MKKKAVLVSLAIALLVAAAIGGTYASFNTESQNPGEATINLNDMKVALAAKPGEENKKTIPEFALPGQRVELPGYTVRNDLKENAYDIYTRVIIDKQWAGDYKDSLDAGMISLLKDGKNLEENVGEIVDGWLVQSADSEQIVLYYTGKLGPEAETTTFLDEIDFDKTMDNAYADKQVNINITVCAVQATSDTKVSEKAMFAEWGMFPVFDDAGNITGIEE